MQLEPDSSTTMQLEADGKLLRTRQRSDGILAQAHGSRSRVVWWVLGFCGLVVAVTMLALDGTRPPATGTTTCLGGWPEFRTAATLVGPWAAYIRAIYGTRPMLAAAYPLCIGDLWMLYSHGLEAARIGSSLPGSLEQCPRDDGSVAGQRYEVNSKLSPPNVSWAWHPRPDGFTPLDADDWVEVLHKGGIEDEHVGAWFLSARGSGIWLNVGRTIAFDDHADGWQHFGVANLTGGFKARNEAMCANASAAGYDTLQFVRHTCMMMYSDCLNMSTPNLTYFNLEVVSTKLVGIYPCASPDGKTPLLRTGWPQEADGGAPCTCDNNVSMHLHCAEVPPSLWALGIAAPPQELVELVDDRPVYFRQPVLGP